MVQLTLTLKMTTAQVVETSVTVNNNSHIQGYTFTRTIKLNLLLIMILMRLVGFFLVRFITEITLPINMPFLSPPSSQYRRGLTIFKKEKTYQRQVFKARKSQILCAVCIND